MRNEIKHLWSLVEPVVRGAGFDLVELDYGREQGGWVLRLYVDRGSVEAPRLPGGPSLDALAPAPGVSFDDCARVSHEVSAVLDVADAIPHGYRLEVSSPGLDRPLRREADFRRFGGRTVKLRTQDPVEGRRNFLGTLLDAHDGVVRIECDGRHYQVPVVGLVKANLVPDWQAEFKKAERSAS